MSRFIICQIDPEILCGAFCLQAQVQDYYEQEDQVRRRQARNMSQVCEKTAPTLVAATKLKQKAHQAKGGGGPMATTNQQKQQHQAEDIKQVSGDRRHHRASNTTQSKLVANLHSAASEGKVELVRLLLRCGADANAQDDEVSLEFLQISALLVSYQISALASSPSSPAVVVVTPTIASTAAVSAVARHARHRVSHLHGVCHGHRHRVASAATASSSVTSSTSPISAAVATAMMTHHDDHVALAFALLVLLFCVDTRADCDQK